MIVFPKNLEEIPACPKNLFTKGRELEREFEGIAIVGTRKASAEGLAIAEEFARSLASAGISIVSGLAFGIDSAAHRGCLAVRGRTIAVLAGGIVKIYPATNAPLAEKIISAGGSIVSEYQDEPSYPDLFLRRNRIISGLSKAVIIIEAPLKSGAVSTAAWAAEQGREVFVVPGPISHPNYTGSHKLLRDGARLVTSPEEVLSDLGIKSSVISMAQNEELPEDAVAILEFISISHQAVSIDKIISTTKLEPQKVMTILTELTINGKIIETPGGYASRFKK